jgi:dTDP-glucose pyrophosphorylase/CBS domain-containing protein
MADWERLLVGPEDPVRAVMAVIDRAAKGIALVVDADRRLLGTITDGDIRRAILAGLGVDIPARLLLDRKAPRYARPATAPAGTPAPQLIELMHEHAVRHLPLLDGDGQVAGLFTLDELVPSSLPPVRAVIMAGGSGVRLRPLTDDTPKPMLPVGDRPLMELTLERLRQAGIQRVNVATHYRPEKITEHFGDGSAFGMKIDYVSEEQPLGTAGALGLIGKTEESLLVINGDILTRMDFRALVEYHCKHGADLTVAVREYALQMPYGAIESDGPRVVRVTEKPTVRFLVNAGIYLVEPRVLSYLVPGQRADMTDLIQKLIDDGRTVVSFPIVEYWLDIGQLADYERAQIDIQDEGWNL